jgi:hypothetical protein
MRILFFMRHQGYARNFESTLDELARRGHDLHLALDRVLDTVDGRPTLELLQALGERHPKLTWGPAPDQMVDAREDFGRRTRAAIDWMHYLSPELASATKARERTERRAPKLVRRIASRARFRPRVVALMLRVARAVEMGTPVRPADRAFLLEHAPDLVLVTPLVDGGSQTGYLRAAHSLGMRTGLCVSSWDNLTSKGVMHEMPGIVTLWNEAQAVEARKLHGVPAGRVVTTGAQAWDHWFEWTTSTTREQFLRDAGLDPDKPVVLYMCSSGFIGGHEADHVKAWIERLRASDAPELRDVGVLIRPHPTNASQWRDFELAGFDQVALWRLRDTEPATKRAKDEFFDTIRHSDVVVGLNSTALIESAIIGRPVLTWLTPEYEDSQNGTMHFGLIAGPDGMLIVGRTWSEHLDQLRAALRDEDVDGDRRRRFIGSFVRPRGTRVRATDALADALEQAATAPPPAPARSLRSSVIRVLLTPVVKWPMAPYDKVRLRAQREAGIGGQSRLAQILAIVRSLTALRRRRRTLVKRLRTMVKRLHSRVKRLRRLRRHKQLPWIVLLRLLTTDKTPRGRLLRSSPPPAARQPRVPRDKLKPVSKNAAE